ncbi:MAG TPA: hypothetical protein VL202_17735 [Pararhizobium sp.]|uniref:hypothetical protein n=1 Tax=Pararhizobium sp. TaxID=1977563 RepID=UPI002BCD536F|nr:hypothetical protein [Pararhizobium sp.]HTO33001.1 hypothetical protein [Pararhizobium sp.]
MTSGASIEQHFPFHKPQKAKIAGRGGKIERSLKHSDLNRIRALQMGMKHLILLDNV